MSRALMRLRRTLTFYGFVAPWLLGFVLLTVYPLLFAVDVSFTNWDGIAESPQYIGTRNYERIAEDDRTLHSIVRTGIFTVTSVTLLVAIGLAMAVLVNQKIRGRGLFRTIFYLPAIVPPVAGALAWRLLFDRDTGAANGAVESLGGKAITWLDEPYVFYVLISLVLWGVGYNMLISLAGLQDIPVELREAAKVDGASAWRAFWEVTLPLLSPVLLFQVVTGVIAALQTFVPVLLLTQGARGAGAVSQVKESNYLFLVHVFGQYFTYQRAGYASAMLWVFFLVIVAVTAIIFKASSRAVFYSVDPKGRS